MCFNITLKKKKEVQLNSKVVLRGKPTKVIQTAIPKQAMQLHFLWSFKLTRSFHICGNESREERN